MNPITDPSNYLGFSEFFFKRKKESICTSMTHKEKEGRLEVDTKRNQSFSLSCGLALMENGEYIVHNTQVVPM